MNVAARYVPAVAELSVGGDWYDVVQLEGTRVAIAVGDIVGRGINAAAVMGQLRSALSALARTTDSAVEAVARLDRFAHGIEGAKATTLLYGIVDSAAGTLRYTSAGHPPALVVDANGDTRFLEDGRGWPLAVADPDRRRPEAVADLPPGSTIVLYTDGLVERRTEPLEDGLARLAHAAAAPRAPSRRTSCATSCSTSWSATTTATTSRWLRCGCRAARAPSFSCRVPATPAELATVRRELREWLARQELPGRDPRRHAARGRRGVFERRSSTRTPTASATRSSIEGFRSDEQLVFTVRDYGEWRPARCKPRSATADSRSIAEVTDDVKISSARDGGTRVEMRRSIVDTSARA